MTLLFWKVRSLVLARFESTLIIRRSILLTDVSVAPAVPAVPEMPVEQAVPDVGTVATESHHGENRMYPLSARDIVVANSMPNFVRNIGDPFTRAQAHAMLRSILILMVMVPFAAALLQVEDRLGPSLFVTILDIAENVHNVPDKARRRSHLATVFCAAAAHLAPGYPDDPRAFHMAQFV